MSLTPFSSLTFVRLACLDCMTTTHTSFFSRPWAYWDCQPPLYHYLSP